MPLFGYLSGMDIGISLPADLFRSRLKERRARRGDKEIRQDSSIARRENVSAVIFSNSRVPSQCQRLFIIACRLP